MSESSEECFERDVARALRFETLVTFDQQRRAKERLLVAAAQMTQPPEAAVEKKVLLRQKLHIWKQHTCRLLALLLTDSTIYERARQPRRPSGYYHISGRYILGVIYMSA